MDKKIIDAVKNEAKRITVEAAALMAFVEVESGGKGFSTDGKIIIQFEPSWFKRKAPYAPSGVWSVNKVDRQLQEWIAFNNAFKINPNAAMESTSIGLGQIMGFHYKRLGYATVGAMWDDAKKSEARQIWQMAEFIRMNNPLLRALKDKNWHMVAVNYNGSGYLELAKKYGRIPYNTSMANAYAKWSKLI